MILRNTPVDSVAEKVIGAAIEVHRTMGPGLLESIYRECLMIELGGRGLRVDVEHPVPVAYKGVPLIARFRVDLLVEQCLVLELKAVEAIRPVHKAQVISYLKITGLPAGLLINFNEATLTAGLHRLEHPERYARLKTQPPS